MALRYAGGPADVTLRVPKRGLFRQRSNNVSCDLIDLSIDGALVSLPADVAVHEGVRVELSLDGEHATVGIRHVQPAHAGRRLCGVAFRTTSTGFDAVVNETIAAVITDPRRHDPWRMNG